MPVISAIREAEGWSGGSILLGVVLLIAIIWLIIRTSRRFINGSPRR